MLPEFVVYGSTSLKAHEKVGQAGLCLFAFSKAMRHAWNRCKVVRNRACQFVAFTGLREYAWLSGDVTTPITTNEAPYGNTLKAATDCP